MAEENANFNRDMFALNLLIKRYEEQERKIGMIDTKISNMIAVIGTLLTIQTSIFTFLLSKFIENGMTIVKIIFFILILILVCVLLGYYVYSMKKFIDAYFFRKFKAMPNHVRLIERVTIENNTHHELIGSLICSVGDAIEHNKNEIHNKVDSAKKGFMLFESAALFSISFVLLFLIIVLILS